MESQNEQIKIHLESGFKITPLEALYLFDCLRLGARIYDLKKEGLSIKTRMKKDGIKRFAEYSLLK